MSYNTKKCTFVPMSSVGRVQRTKKEVKLPKINHATALKDWQDGWFKGHYELKNESKR
jgi:hypothetical protein